MSLLVDKGIGSRSSSWALGKSRIITRCNVVCQTRFVVDQFGLMLLTPSAQCFVILTLEVKVQVSGFRQSHCERESLQEFELNSDMDFLGSGNFFESGVYNKFDEVAFREHFQSLCAKAGVECKEHFARAHTATETFELHSDMDFLGSGNFFVSGVYNIFDEVAIREHFQNLCAKVGVECKEHFARAQTATETRDWAVAYSEWTSCRDIIVRSEGLLDRDERLWLSSCYKLVSANLWAFHSKKFELALNASIEALLANVALKNAPEALSFPILPTLWTMIFLWASTSECEEETLDPNVRSFLTTVYPGNAVPDCEVRILKQQCKYFVINEWKFVIWEVQKQYFYYFEIEECLRWAREGNKLYGEKYHGKLDYVSKLYEAATLFMTGACEEVIKVCEKIRETLKLERSQINDMNIYPAARYCTVEYAFMIHQILYICYWNIILGPGQSTKIMIEQQAKLGEEWNILLSQIYSDVQKLWPLKICLEESMEHAKNNRYEVDVFCICS